MRKKWDLTDKKKYRDWFATKHLTTGSRLKSHKCTLFPETERFFFIRYACLTRTGKNRNGVGLLHRVYKNDWLCSRFYSIKMQKKVYFPPPVTYNRNSRIVGSDSEGNRVVWMGKVVRYIIRVCFNAKYLRGCADFVLSLYPAHAKIHWLYLFPSRRRPRISVDVDRNKIATYGINVRVIANNAKKKKFNEAKVTRGATRLDAREEEIIEIP